MKNVIISVLSVVLFISCNEKKNNLTASESAYKSFGSKILTENVISSKELNSKFNTLKTGDTISVKFKSVIKEVCQNKGCWMKLDLGNNEEVFVKFKDYAFFMPKDAMKSEVILNGKAFVNQESVEDQKHYASDAGKSKEEIDAIVAPKAIYSFIADGVLIKK